MAGGEVHGRHASPDTASPARAEIAAPLASGVEPEMWKCCSKRSILRGCGRFGHPETRVACNEIPLLEGVAGLSRGELARSTPGSRNLTSKHLKLSAAAKSLYGRGIWTIFHRPGSLCIQVHAFPLRTLVVGTRKNGHESGDDATASSAAPPRSDRREVFLPPRTCDRECALNALELRASTLLINRRTPPGCRRARRRRPPGRAP